VLVHVALNSFRSDGISLPERFFGVMGLAIVKNKISWTEKMLKNENKCDKIKNLTMDKKADDV